MCKHSARICAHELFILNMEVAEHFVRSPATDKLDNVGVDAGGEEGVGARGT